ncbi:MAG: hypothetical protein LBS21_14240, partial [Clostridiales bacterium]|nr:hypothetical protein [Clostridiales bacterium]
MKKGFSPRLAVGFLILALCLITERFVTVIPDIFAEILYGVSALLILSGWFSFLFYPAKTRQITDGLYAVKTLLVSFFVMESSGSYIVF